MQLHGINTLWGYGKLSDWRYLFEIYVVPILTGLKSDVLSFKKCNSLADISLEILLRVQFKNSQKRP